MKILRTLVVGLAALAAVLFQQFPAKGDTPPTIASLTVPKSGGMIMMFHGGTGPFQVQKKMSMDPSAPWIDIPEAQVTSVNTGVYMAVLPMGQENAAYYRVLSVGETIVELKGWSINMKVSAPANGLYFIPGERPVVTVTLLDNFAQGLSRTDFSSLNLYMYGPQDLQKTVTAVKLLNASTNRAARPHHYIDLKTNPNVQVYNNVFTYQLQPVTDEAPGTYRLGLWAVRGTDAVQQVMRYSDVQIRTATVETNGITKSACAACHQGPISGKIYMHHIDPGYSPVGSWSLDDDPAASCKCCHNNDGYAAYTDRSIPGVTNLVSDSFVRRTHGVHFGPELKLPANTNSVNGDFRDYLHAEFPADIRNCTKCHVDDRWKTRPSRQACGACHDNLWFGALAQTPPGMEAHPPPGGPRSTDTGCWICHPADGEMDPPNDVYPVTGAHKIPTPKTNALDIALTPPANGKYYVAGERPVVSLVFKNDAGNSIGDHRVVTSANFSTARLFVYGPRSRAMPVLTSNAKYGVETARASVTCSINGPWAISNKVFRIAINGSAPQNIVIPGYSNLVTAAQVVAALNPIITNLNGGALATVSSSTRVQIRTLIRGATARIEIYAGEVTTAMGWKATGVVLDPDVFVATVSTPGNDLRPVTDPLDFTDPMVTRTTTNILYQLDDVAGLTAGTYGIYAYYLPVAGKIAGITNLTGYGQLNFQVGTATLEKKVATRCNDCHGDVIFHLTGSIHAEPFDTDYCNACHDYGHPNTGDMYKNQGGTSLNGWSGYGAMPISRRTHAAHRGNYLEHPEEVYANATVDTFGHIIFPQDIRNCTKCHAESDTWKQKPSRLACLACHDSDDAKTHGLLMTSIPDPNDPYGPKAKESCNVCHGADRPYSPDKVHSISNPYVPPYPRAPRGE